MIDFKTKFVSVFVYTIAPADLPAFANELALIMQRRVSPVKGFLEGIVMANESKTQVLSVTQWESRGAWSGAQWNEEIGRSLVDFVESASAFEFHTFEPITVVRGSSG